MSKITVRQAKKINGVLRVPADKSITHRAVMISSIAKGKSIVHNFLNGGDCMATIDAFKHMGISIEENGANLSISGRGLYGLNKPESELYLGNSGTTARLLMGILAAQPFSTVLTGDESLSKRPMDRVCAPLSEMGASFSSGGKKNSLPITITGGKLKPINYTTPVPSAQVKSSILLAGLYAGGLTTVSEKVRSRDHTERMLALFGADIKRDGLKAVVKGGIDLKAHDVRVPGDISSSAFFIALAALLNKSRITVEEVGTNPARTGFLEVLKRMGGRFDLNNTEERDSEPAADITVSHSGLNGVEIKEDEIPAMIDEIPIIMVLASLSEGLSVIKGAGELRVKETDRISSMSANLAKMGACIKIDDDDIIIKGPSKLKGASVESFGDHRTAMAMIIAGLCAEGDTTVMDTQCIDTSFPRFMDTLKRVVIF